MKREPDQKQADAYFSQSRGWAVDRLAELRASRRLAWIVAACVGALALVEALALLALIPLKSVVPYTVLVDRQTGYVQALNPASIPNVQRNAALTQSLLVQYVEAREGFDISQLQVAYRRVGLWSGETARSDYLSLMRMGNPAGPLARLPRSTIIDVQVKSVSQVGPQAALVRFDTVRRDAGVATAVAQPWIAILRYRFSDAGMTLADRFQNPLGFQVVRYRRDPEALVPATITSTQPVTPTPLAQVGTAPGAVILAPRQPAAVRQPTAGTAARQPAAIVLDARTVPLGSPFQSLSPAQQ